MTESLTALQEIVAHQELEISRLSDEIYAQQREIAQLRQMLLKFKETVESLSQLRSAEDETPPPHY